MPIRFLINIVVVVNFYNFYLNYMNINKLILRYSLFGIAGGQEVDRNFSFLKLNKFSLAYY